uniref:GH18 domain-containing protein n=1 Tax=Ditylenchus dipsaci TaxID=166011 RepID=A0A915DAT8_9BILA
MATFAPGLGEHDNSEQDSILSKWLKSGLKREVLVIELPSYGLTKKLFGSPAQARSNPKGGIQDVKEMMGVDKISQEEICELLKKEIKPKNTTLYPYEMIIDYKQTIDTAVSFESAQTITYKTRYAMREQLAGIALSALHQDDYSNKCGKGAFPLLQAVNTATKCNKPTTPIAIETKEIQPTNP